METNNKKKEKWMERGRSGRRRRKKEEKWKEKKKEGEEVGDKGEEGGEAVCKGAFKVNKPRKNVDNLFLASQK